MAGSDAYVQVEVVDAVTGSGVDGATVGTPAPWGMVPRHGEDRGGGRFTFDDGLERRGGEQTFNLAVYPPTGFVRNPSRAFHPRATVSRYARQVRIVEPLRREASVMLAIHGVGGDPAAGAEVTGLRIAGRPLPNPEGSTDADGRLTIPGVPHLQGEPLWARAQSGILSIAGSVKLPATASELAVLDFTAIAGLPEPKEPSVQVDWSQFAFG